MKQGRSLPEVLTELRRQNEAKRDFIGPAQAFTLQPDGRTFQVQHYGSGMLETFDTTDLFHRQVGGFVKKTRHPNFVNSYFGHCMTPSVWVAQRKDDMVSRSSGTLDTLAAFRYYQPTTGACNDPGGRPRGRRAPFPSWLSYHAACDSA